MGTKRGNGKPAGRVVRLLGFTGDKRAEVKSLLSIQFTAEWMDGTRTLSYLFYADKGVTWEDVDEK